MGLSQCIFKWENKVHTLVCFKSCHLCLWVLSAQGLSPVRLCSCINFVSSTILVSGTGGEVSNTFWDTVLEVPNTGLCQEGSFCHTERSRYWVVDCIEEPSLAMASNLPFCSDLKRIGPLVGKDKNTQVNVCGMNTIVLNLCWPKTSRLTSYFSSKNGLT